MADRDSSAADGTVPPARGVPIVRGGSLPGLVYLGLVVHGGGTLIGVLWLVSILRKMRARSPR